MKKFSNWIASHSKLIVIICTFLLIPAIYGIYKTKINYDILVYLPDSIDTIKGENILTDEFNLGSYAFVMSENASQKEMLKLQDKIKEIEGVNEVFSLANVTDSAIPPSMLPDEILEKLYHGNETIMMVTLKGSTSEESTMNAIRNLREVVGDASSISSMSAMVLDTRDLSNSEITTYILIAVSLCLVALALATDSYMIPILLLLNIGYAILYNMGTNIFLGEISYITKAISAILQLGVTTDFSIFLYHKYEERKKDNANRLEAMAEAIEDTFQSVIGSSLTTFAGFLALCTMDLTLGTDIGLVMAKGVLWGLICVLTLFPSFLLTFDHFIHKTKHKQIFPSFKKVGEFVVNHNKALIGVFLLLLIPAFIGNAKYEVYYKLDDSLPDNLAFKIANTKLSENYGITSPEIILLEKDLKTSDVENLVNEIKQVENMDFVLAPSVLLNDNMMNLLPEEINHLLNNESYQLIIANSKYEIASSELNHQLDEINKIVKKYDEKAIVAGEGALMKDLVQIADHDFKMVNYTSMIVIFIIMVLVLKSINLPIILVLTIEFAIYLNMSVAYFTNTRLPFIASIVVGTIQLGATIDYAILMSTRYLEERKKKEKKDAMRETLKFTIPSIISSALCFFMATFGVAVFTKIDMIGSICELLARGSIISMLVVIFILPSLLMLSDKFIYKKKEGKKMKKKLLQASILVGFLFIPTHALAYTKTETIYSNLDYDGSVYKTVVNNHLYIKDEKQIEEETILKDILNISGEEEFTLNDHKLTWQTNFRDIMYQGSIDKDLPIKTTIHYFLDEEEMNPVDMVGKSGKIKIEIDFENTSYVYRGSMKLYTPFVVSMGTILDNYASDIHVTNGKSILTGTKNIIASLAAPGLYDSLKINDFKDLDHIKIEYTTTNFKLNNMYIIASPKLLEEIDIQKLNNLDKLASGINSIGTNMDKIESGSLSLKEGSASLVSGAQTISSSLFETLDGSKKLSMASSEIREGLSSVSQALNIKELEKLKQANESTIESLTNANKEIALAFENYHLSINMTLEELDALPNDLINETLKNTLKTYKTTYDNNQKFILLLTSNNTSVNLTITSLAPAIKKLEVGSSSLNEGLNSLNSALNKMYGGSIALKEGASMLNKGASTLNEGITKLNKEGIGELEKYANQATYYTNILKELITLSKEYKGYASSNAASSTFILKVKSAK